jgi:hypothetical protein
MCNNGSGGTHTIPAASLLYDTILVSTGIRDTKFFFGRIQIRNSRWWIRIQIWIGFSTNKYRQNTVFWSFWLLPVYYNKNKFSLKSEMYALKTIRITWNPWYAGKIIIWGRIRIQNSLESRIRVKNKQIHIHNAGVGSKNGEYSRSCRIVQQYCIR